MDEEGKLETWEYQSNDFAQIVNWKQIGALKIGAAYNLYIAEFTTDTNSTRLSVPLADRKNGMIIAYEIDGKPVMEQYYSDSSSVNDASWILENNWKKVLFNNDMVEYVSDLPGERIFLSRNTNLYNENNLQENMALRNTSTGIRLQDMKGYNSSQYIPVKPNQTYTISCESGTIYTLGEFSHAEIDSLTKFTEINQREEFSFTTTDRTKYILVSVTANTKDMMINKGSSSLPYEEYNLSIGKDIYGNKVLVNDTDIKDGAINRKKISNDLLNEIENSKSKLVLDVSKNLFNENTAQNDVCLRGATMLSENFSGYKTSSFIKVNPNTDYTIGIDPSVGNIYSICQYSDSKLDSYVDGTFLTINSNDIYTFATTRQTKYILVCFYNPTAPMINEGSSALPYESYNRETIIKSDVEGRKVSIGNEKSDFSVKHSENLIIPEMFTKVGLYKYNTLTPDDDYCYANQKIPIRGGVTYIAKGRYIGINWYDTNDNYISYSTISEADGEKIVSPSNAAWALITISYNNFVKDTDCILNEGEELSDEKRGIFPVIDKYKDGYPLKANISDSDKMLFSKSFLAGKKYASLGDSISNRDQWQEVLDFYSGMTHVNFAVGGISMGKFPFKYGTEGSEDTGDIDAATATGLISSEDLEGCDYIIICGYANNAGGNGTTLGTIDDDYVHISKDDAELSTSYEEYAQIIKNQTFYAQCKSIIEYIQSLAPSAKIIGAGQLKMSIPMYGDDGALDSSVNFRRKNKKGYCVSDYSNAMEEVFNYFGLPFVNMDKNCGINEFNQETVYPTDDKVHCNFVQFKGGNDFPFSGMKLMAELIYSKLVHIG